VSDVCIAFEDACRNPASALSDFPQELWDLVKDNFTAMLMSVDEAAAYGLRLMKVQETPGFGGEQYIRRDFECSICMNTNPWVNSNNGYLLCLTREASRSISRTTRLNAACHCHFGRTNIQSLSAIISSRPQRIKTPSSQFVGRQLGGGFLCVHARLVFGHSDFHRNYTIVVKLSNFSWGIYVVNVQICDIHFRVRCRLMTTS
jgi:hypothetical protein